MVNPPVVVSAASAHKKFPAAINVLDVFVVPDTSSNVADVVVPSNTAPSVEFKVIPALTLAKPDWVTVGVNVDADKIATLVLPAYIELTTLSPPELPSVSIFQPDKV